MNRLEKVTISLLAGVMFSFSARTNGVIETNNPYATISSRNVFKLGLTVSSGVSIPPSKLPPKIVLKGMMSLFGLPQVLFNVENTNSPGESLKNDCCILKEGQNQEGIRVVQINLEAEVATFDNNGFVQIIPLADVPQVKMPTLMKSEPIALVAANIPKSYPSEYLRSTRPDYLGGGPDATVNGEPLQDVSKEGQIVIIEAQRAYLKSQNDPAADFLPPTALTPTDSFVSKEGQPPQ